MKYNIQTADSPRWANEEQTAIIINVKFFERAETFPFTATSYDPEDYGQDVFVRAVRGDYGTIQEYIPPEPTPETKPEPVKVESPNGKLWELKVADDGTIVTEEVPGK